MIFNSTLASKIYLSLFLLIIYRFGTYVPLPGVDFVAARSLFSTSGFFGIFDVFSGGAFGRMAIFALSVIPYIVSSIIVQLLSTSSSRDDSFLDFSDKRKMSFYTKILAVFLCIFQGVVVVFGLENMDLFSKDVDLNSNFVRFVAIITILGGTMMLVCMGDIITSFGIGNGISLIIFAGIVAELLPAFYQILSFKDFGRSSIVLLSVFIFLFLTWFVVFMERSFRNVPVQFPRRQVGNKMYNSSLSHIPIKINVSGVMPPIFASAILMLPVTIVGFSSNSNFTEFFSVYFAPGTFCYMLSYFVLILFFCFFYSSMAFNSEEISSMLKKSGGFIVGIRPGNNTLSYLSVLVKSTTVFGSLYLGFVCVVPEFFRSNYSIPLVVGGTSMLIVVGVVSEVYSNIQSSFFSKQYESMMSSLNKAGFKR